MIIISQDKLQIFNFETAKNIWIEEEEVEINQIEQTAYSIYIDGEIVGAYLTEERAKEVLQEIVKAYKETNYEYENCWCLRNVIYEMPKE
mgnify:CR=1 FL=1